MTSRLHSFFGYGCSFFVGVVCTFFVLRGGDNDRRPTPELSADTDVDSAPNLAPDTESVSEHTDSMQEAHHIVLTPETDNDFSTPVPTEWEQPLFIILDQTNSALRKQGLINMAVNTAAHVPKVQAVCMKHLAFSLAEEDYPQFLFLIRNSALPASIKANFFSDTLKIRRKEFSIWLAKSLINDPQPDISSLAVGFLNKAQNPN